MTAYVTSPAEPKEIDEKLSMELRHAPPTRASRGAPAGDAWCDNCAYYLENTADISYCWHPKLRILVGADWSCAWWESGSEAQQ